MKLLSVVSLLTATLSLVSAQTHSLCNPMSRDDCPKNPALSGKYSHSFSQSKGAAPRFTKVQQGELLYKDDGAHLRISKAGESGPQIQSDFYIMFGKLEIRMKSAPGQGIVSSIVLQSDSLDEVDWEFVTHQPNSAQSNYFGNGDDGTYDRGGTHPVNNHLDWHTYTILWTPTSLQWIIDGTVVRELTPAMTKGHHHYPQSPMQIRIGSWAGGDESNNAPGTVEWAGGPTDFSKGPFDMTIDYISVEDYSTGKSYYYTDRSGKLASIASEGGKIYSGGAVDNTPPPPSTTKTTTSTTSTTSSSTSKPPPTTTKSTATPTPTDKNDDKDDEDDGDDKDDTKTTQSSSSTTTSSSSTTTSRPTSTSTTKSGFETSTTKGTETEQPTSSSSPTSSVLPVEGDSAAASFKANGLAWALVFGMTTALLL